MVVVLTIMVVRVAHGGSVDGNAGGIQGEVKQIHSHFTMNIDSSAYMYNVSRINIKFYYFIFS